jgi:hypothetical protein
VVAILVVEVIVVGEVVAALVGVVMEAAVIFLEMEDEAEQLLTILSIEDESARMKVREDDEVENWALEVEVAVEAKAVLETAEAQESVGELVVVVGVEVIM